jgi:hypothetical protein
MNNLTHHASTQRSVVSPDGTSELGSVDDAADPAEVENQNSKAPTIRTTRNVDTAIDVEQWFRDARVLDEKFDKLIAKLDALILVLDSCLGNVSGISAMSNLKSALENFRSGAKDLHRMFEPVRAAITSAYTVANKMEDSGKQEELRKAAKEAEKIFSEFYLNTTQPSVRVRVDNTLASDESDSTAETSEDYPDSASSTSEEESDVIIESSEEHSDSASPASEEGSDSLSKGT